LTATSSTTLFWVLMTLIGGPQTRAYDMSNDTVDAGPSFESKAATLGVATFAKKQEKAIARVKRRNRSKGQIDRWDL
jgi:hypothetical protein